MQLWFLWADTFKISFQSLPGTSSKALPIWLDSVALDSVALDTDPSSAEETCFQLRQELLLW